ncbi:hypothetical protein HRE53_28430 (plasmid) [Acaryochloris sp. 'Moss Beach']|uniref:hypothetical protein n=1 Tax=Acaryochloris sp. 'Moss Beach' TaxID=2740837 RepID=UPI001F39EE5E|nr:hypothetical protein [Acaryochloris sp. 'Moss Beach']UJB72535.1 hypothetical protein HRE53_28430 [Acaryochloris sp. 'Moss Beach']
MAADEGRFGRLGQVRRAWCAPGIRPESGQQLVREYLYGYVAVAPALGKMSALVLPFSNTQMMNLFLAQVADEFSDGSVAKIGSALRTSGNLRSCVSSLSRQ